MRIFIDTVQRRLRRLLPAASSPLARVRQRLRRLGTAEGAALAVVVLALVVGPATVFGYGHWMDRHVAVVHARQWEFSPKVLHATAGVPLKIRIDSGDVVHGFKIDNLNVKITELIPGKSIEFTVTAPKPGTYYYECNTYCGLRHAKMFGKLIVTAP